MKSLHFEMARAGGALWRWWAALLLLAIITHGVEGNLPPEFVSSMDLHVVSEDSPVGASVYRLEATDPEGGPVRYSVSGTDALAVDPVSGVVTVIKALDRETADSVRLSVTAEDEVTGGANNVVTLPVTLIVIDANDNPPAFRQSSYRATVGEDSSPGATVLSGIEITDLDQVGDAIDLRCVPKPDDADACSVFRVETIRRSAAQFSGSLVLAAPVSYGRQRSYSFTLQATDGDLMSEADVTVAVKDVQNRSPEFRGSRTGVVMEDAAIGSVVMTIRATDGDVGSPRPVMFDLLENPHEFFSLEPLTGELRTARPLDREALVEGDGVVRLMVKAYEVDASGSAAGDADSSTEAMITVTIRDVNDEPPSFSRREYRTSVPENVADGTPLGGLDIVVHDTDVGSNAMFELSLVDSSGKFSVEPAFASGSSSVSLRLAKGPLDYENPSERKFILQVVARETRTDEKLSSTATVVVSVTDVNDNAPYFDQDAYTARINETAVPGTVVATITASDRDEARLGSQGIVYSLGGNGADRFRVDRDTGVISVMDCDTPGAGDCLDYETRNTYFLSLQASDNDGAPGASKSRVVPVKVSLEDANDNSPVFSRTVYISAIDEKTPDFDPPLIVKAVDPDVLSRIMYSIVGGDPSQLFAMHPRTGRITLTNTSAGLDISDLASDTVTLAVEASDGTGTSTAEVRITVRDANNHSPEFSKPLYLAAVQETAAVGSAVVQVMATDGDVGNNAAVSFRIQRGAFHDFALNSSTGVLTVAQPLDYDKRETYAIEVLGSDAGRPQRVSTATVTLSVVNNNDKSPQLTPHTQRTQVREDAEPGLVIYKIAAKDPDVTSDQGLRYHVTGVLSAVDGNGRPLERDMLAMIENMFTMNELTGEVMVSQPVDRELVTEVTLGVRVTDVSAEPPQDGYGALVITLLDVNDFPPIFPAPWSPESPVIRLTIAEELPLGTVITTMGATDVDSNIGGYNLTVEDPAPSPPNSNEPPVEPILSIDSATGVVTVSGRLDYEHYTQVVCSVLVWDTGLPQLTTTATLVVELVNLNDEAPEFEKESYSASVEEHSPPGTSVLHVRAIDRDQGHLGHVLYALTGTRASLFTISEEGVVMVAAGASLDRETDDSIALRVVAADAAPAGETPRHTSVPLVVSITDINDHVPVFSLKEYAAAVVENLPLLPPAPILQLTAHDADTGPNALIAYTIVSGNEEGNFRLDPSTGILYPAKPLRREVPSGPGGDSPSFFYHLAVVATDRNGTGRSSSEAAVVVSLLPQNQHKPSFLSPIRPNQTVSVTENVSAPVDVVTVTASDGDVGNNGVVRYHFRVGDANVQETEQFSIDAETGLLRATATLDREHIAKYELVLVAKDQGSPISYETLRVLTVLVADVDDHKPEFVNGGQVDGQLTHYVFRITENRSPDARIGRVKAVDEDADTNAQVYYHLLDGNTNSSFYIDKLHGVLYSSRTLDREERANYTLLVAATNSPTIDPAVAAAVASAANATAAHRQLGQQEMSYNNGSLASLLVIVDDENDSPPTFDRKEYFAGISSTAEVDRLVRVVYAHDPDAGGNGTLHYTITAANLYKPGESKSIGSLVPAPFRLEGSSGRLMTAALMTQYRHHRFRLELQAKEAAPPYRVARTSVHVWVWESDQLVRVVLSQPPREVMERQQAIADTLSRVAEGTAVVDEVRYHVRQDNTVNTQWTDMLVHVVNSSGHVLAIEDVLVQMDKGYLELTKPSHDFSIHNVYPAHLPPVTGEVDFRVAGLIALLVVLFIGFVSFSVVCCCLRYWVMSPSGKSQENLLKRGLEDDIGINKTENPLWLDQKLKRYEEQELSMHVMSEFDTTAPPVGLVPLADQGDIPHGVTLDAEWNPERSGHMDMNQPRFIPQMDGQSNTYATIQKSHGGTIRSMQLRTLTAEDGPRCGDPYDYYATLEHLRRSDMGERQQSAGGLPSGPKVPGVQTPHTAFNHVLEGLEFTGSTFQPSDSIGGGIANRPLPDEPQEGGRGVLRVDERGEPILVAELI